jgi:hypothetical protein
MGQMHEPMFPSLSYRAALLQKRSCEGYGNLTDDQRFAYHAYDYGWRRVALDDFSVTSPIDSKGVWFNASLATQAEAVWRRTFNRPAAEAVIKPLRFDDDVIHVAKVCAQIRANVERFAKQTQSPFRAPKTAKNIAHEIPDTIAGQPWRAKTEGAA